MTEKDKESNLNQEIDLIYLFRKIKELIFSIGLFFLKTILFFKNNFIYILGLIILGFGIGFLLEAVIKEKEYSEIIVIPNFNSHEYLYKEIESINSSKNSLKKSNPNLGYLESIKVEPIYEVDDILLENKTSNQNLDFLKSYFENKDEIKKEMKEDNLKSLYKKHLITIVTSNPRYTKSVTDYVLNKINSSKYYLQKKSFEQTNLIEQKQQLNLSIVQINNMLNLLGNEKGLKEEKGVSINTYTELSQLVSLKNNYVDKLSEIDSKIIESKYVIYPLNISLNITKVKDFSTNYKLIFSLGFILCFFIFKFYKELKNRYKDYI